MVDFEKIQWALNFLISNALRYSLVKSTVLIAAEQDSSKVTFSLKDAGKRIPSAYPPKIFDRYFLTPSLYTEGTGLGLAICKEFIVAHEGTIWVSSKVGKGSTFSFKLDAVE